MQKILYILLVLATFILLLAGCGKSVANEKQIKEDLTFFADFLEDEEEVKSVQIEKRQTDKDAKFDTVWCTVVTEDQDCSYQKGVILNYGLYSDKGWVLDNVSTNSKNDWVITPLAGIKEDDIPLSLKSQTITINNEPWQITPKNISIIKHNTDLENQTDDITAEITIEDTIQEATGQLTLTYIFDKEWKIDSISGEESFEISTIPGKEPDVTKEKLIEALSGEKCKYGAPKNDNSGMLYVVQNITLNKNEISNLKIESSETAKKGTVQKYTISCTLTKPTAEFATNATITYNYSNPDGWSSKLSDLTMDCTSVSMQGDWRGRYSGVFDAGDVVLTIQDYSADGTITGIYSYTHDPGEKLGRSGSYQVSGIIDPISLNMRLEPGEWIDKPANPRYYEKAKITGRLYVDTSTISGMGQNSNTFDLTK